MDVKAIPITEKFFFWRCGCGWESERLPVSSKNEPPPPHNCNRVSEYRKRESA
jgi:hypothetical protein